MDLAFLKYISRHTTTLKFPEHFDCVNYSDISVVEIAEPSKCECRNNINHCKTKFSNCFTNDLRT